MKFVANILFLLIFLNSYAQKGDLQQEVKNLFFNSSPEIETLNLYGYLYNKIEIQLFLAHNKDDWKGICYYPSSEEKFNLEGGIMDGKLILDEIERNDHIIGSWLIDITKVPYVAKWRNNNGSKTIELQMKLLNTHNKQLDINRATVNIYDGKIMNDDFQFIITDNFNDDLRGNFINIRKKYFLKSTIQCKDAFCNSFVINIDKDKKLKKLVCNAIDNSHIDVVAYNNIGTQFKSRMKSTNSLELANKSFINKKYSLSVSYPIFNNKKLNISFNKELDAIIDSLQEEMEREFFDKYSLDDRLVLQANGWFDIDYYSDEIFSAKFIVQKSYSENTTCIPVIFSLKTGKKINIYDQFSSDFNLKFFIPQFLKENIKKIPDYKSTMIRNYLKPKNFKYITLNVAGIVLSTDFNSIFGVYKLILPYEEVKDKIKKRSILHKIMRP